MRSLILFSLLVSTQAHAYKSKHQVARISCPTNKVMFFLDGRQQCLNLDSPITENPVDALSDSRIDRYISNDATEFNALK